MIRPSQNHGPGASVESPKAQAASAKCFDYVGKGKVKAQKVKNGVCTGFVWRNATISTSHPDNWFYGFDPAHPLPAGTWTAYVRAITRAGIGDPSIIDQYKKSPYRYVFACRPGKCK